MIIFCRYDDISFRLLDHIWESKLSTFFVKNTRKASFSFSLGRRIVDIQFPSIIFPIQGYLLDFWVIWDVNFPLPVTLSNRFLYFNQISSRTCFICNCSTIYYPSHLGPNDEATLHTIFFFLYFSFAYKRKSFFHDGGTPFLFDMLIKSSTCRIFLPSTLAISFRWRYQHVPSFVKLRT